MARKKTGNPHVGSDFESFLVEDGQLEATTAVAIKRVLAWQIAAAMKDANVTQAELARRMRTSRAVVHRLLDADDPSITLSTISRAASALARPMIWLSNSMSALLGRFSSNRWSSPVNALVS